MGPAAVMAVATDRDMALAAVMVGADGAWTTGDGPCTVAVHLAISRTMNRKSRDLLDIAFQRRQGELGLDVHRIEAVHGVGYRLAP